jgi:hypothetical protein
MRGDLYPGSLEQFLLCKEFRRARDGTAATIKIEPASEASEIGTWNHNVERLWSCGEPLKGSIKPKRPL